MKSHFVKLLCLGLVVAAFVYLFFHYNLHVYFSSEDQAIRFLTSFGPLSVLIFIAVQVAQVIIAPIPGDVTGFIGGYLYGAAAGTLYSTIGLTAGSWLAFYLGRLFGLPLVEKLVPVTIIEKYDYFMEHKGRGLSFVLFLIPGFPKDALCYVIGLSRMRTRLFLFISTLGRLFGTILLSVAGSSVRYHHNNVFYIVAAVLGLTALFAWLYRDSLHDLLEKLHKPRHGEKA